MTLHSSEFRDGFGPGQTIVTRLDEDEDNTGIEFSVIKLMAGEKFQLTTKSETAILLMAGDAVFSAGGKTERYSRRSIFDESPRSRFPI